MNERVYIVIPRTIDSDKPPYKLCMSCGRMAAHAAHVAAVLTRASGIDVADKDLIVLSVSNSPELESLVLSLCSEGVSLVEYRDTDKAFEGELLTAIATYPIEKNSSAALKRLRPWCCKCNETPVAQRGSTEQSVLTDRSEAQNLSGVPHS